MTFYHIPDNHLSEDAQYYFNVLAILVEINENQWKEIFPDNINSIWYTEQLLSSKPRIYNFYVNKKRQIEIPEELSDKEHSTNIEIENIYIEILPHQVVEIHPTLGVCIYDMLDFDTKDLWRID